MSDEILDSSAVSILLNEVATSRGSTDTIFEACLDILVQQLGSERGFIMLHDSVFDELRVFAARNINPKTLFTTEEVSSTIIYTVYEEEQPIVSVNALDDPRFAERSSVVLSGLRSVLCVPITVDDGLIGIIYIDNRMKIGAYQQKHLEFLTMCAKELARIILKIFPDTKPKQIK